MSKPLETMSYTRSVNDMVDISVIINPFILVINNHNASSDIGTVAFLDNFAKSNTVDSVCIHDRETQELINKYSGKPLGR